MSAINFKLTFNGHTTLNTGRTQCSIRGDPDSRSEKNLLVLEYCRPCLRIRNSGHHSRSIAGRNDTQALNKAYMDVDGQAAPHSKRQECHSLANGSRQFELPRISLIRYIIQATPAVLKAFLNWIRNRSTGCMCIKSASSLLYQIPTFEVGVRRDMQSFL